MLIMGLLGNLVVVGVVDHRGLRFHWEGRWVEISDLRIGFP